jgi:hypothetical protein
VKVAAVLKILIIFAKWSSEIALKYKYDNEAKCAEKEREREDDIVNCWNECWREIIKGIKRKSDDFTAHTIKKIPVRLRNTRSYH